MRSRLLPSRLLLAVAGFLVVSCRGDDGIGPADFPDLAVVYTDAFGEGVSFQAFGGSKLDALTEDATVRRTGTKSLKFTVPPQGATNGSYAGGAFVANVGRNLTSYNALTFWARSSVNLTLDVAGLGNDNTDGALYPAQRNAIALTPTWTKVVIPIPLASKLTQERGLFFLAEGPEVAAGYEFWVDDVKFENLTTITNPRPALAPVTVAAEVGGTQQVNGLSVTFAVDGTDVLVGAAPSYFTFSSSATSVATVSSTGRITVAAAGSANITATLGTTAATGAVALTATVPPTVAAPTPTRASADVVSIYSGAYTNAAVDTWSAVWDQADVADVTLAGNATKKYTNLVFAGVEMTTTPVNASAMTHLHVDFWAIAPDVRIKLVDFGANGAFGGGDDSESEITLTGTSSPAITPNAWSSLDIPMTAFGGLTGRSRIAQIIISGASRTLYLDNLYFYRTAAPPAATEPTTAAPTPTFLAADVISLFSNAYTNVAVDTWSAVWDNADVADVSIAGNATKRYTNLVFAGIEATTTPIDASQMTRLYMNFWTPSPTAAPAAFRIKLVDFGANGAFGGGDDVEHEITLNATSSPALATGSWVTFDIPLTAFTGLTTKSKIAQLIISGTTSTVFLDNVLFRK
jgi:hypothetical protein